MVFLKDIFENVNFEKNCRQQKSMQTYPACTFDVLVLYLTFLVDFAADMPIIPVDVIRNSS